MIGRAGIERRDTHNNTQQPGTFSPLYWTHWVGHGWTSPVDPPAPVVRNDDPESSRESW